MSARGCPKCGLLHGTERRCYVDRLLEELADVELLPREVSLLRWLAQWDEPTVGAFIGLVRKLRAGGRS